MLCRQSKSHCTRTKQWNPSVIISSITDNCIRAIVCSQHTRLANRNRLCCYRSSHMFPIIDLFAAYHTHLVTLNRFCSIGSAQTVHPSELYAVYRTHLQLAAHFCCSASSQTVSLSELYVVYRTRLHLVACFFCSTSSQTFCTFLTGFLHHHLWLWHRTQFRRRVCDRSVALAASCSTGTQGVPLVFGSCIIS